MKRRKDKNESPVISPEPNEQNGKLPKQPVRLEPLKNISNDKRMSLHLSSEKVSTPGKLPAKENASPKTAAPQTNYLPSINSSNFNDSKEQSKYRNSSIAKKDVYYRNQEEFW